MLGVSHTKVLEWAATHPHDGIKFPLLATPKVDGVRCLTAKLPTPYGQSVALARSLKPIPNLNIQYQLGQLCPGWDGELVAVDEQGNDRNFHETQSRVMSIQGVFPFRYYVFDFIEKMEKPWMPTWTDPSYEERVKCLQMKAYPDCPWMVKLIPQVIGDEIELDLYEEAAIMLGHEGICYRRPDSPYKFGRSTPREQYLVKMKRFEDAEAIVVGFEEEMRNLNVASTSPLGHQVRSSHQALMQGKETLGALIVSMPGRPQFKVGTGFNAQQRKDLWEVRHSLVGKVVKFKHQPHGAKDAPRIPVFIGFRDKLDMSQPELPKQQTTQDELPM